MVGRVAGLLSCTAIASLLAWVAVEWSVVYLRVYSDLGTFRSPYFEPAYRALFAASGLIAGFTVASLVYRQAVSFWHSMLSEITGIPARDKLATVLGIFVGLGLTALVGPLLARIPTYGWQLVVLTGIAAIYLGVAVMVSMKEEIGFFFSSAPAVVTTSTPTHPKLLDTNVIIDGRVAEAARAGFLEGPLYVPGFVLEELHLIADASDAQKRNRGRRGLDILNEMQAQPDLRVGIYTSYATPRVREPVDARLVQLAKDLEASIVTNDANLKKVAQFRGVRVLSINELANAMRPVVLPGEELVVDVVREGTEPDQGVSYLDDGTMVVVAQGKERVGESVRVVVTSSLQTVAGRMIFGNLRDGESAQQELPIRKQRPGGRRELGRKARS
jgi:uncharacterized protein YacL